MNLEAPFSIQLDHITAICEEAIAQITDESEKARGTSEDLSRFRSYALTEASDLRQTQQ